MDDASRTGHRRIGIDNRALPFIFTHAGDGSPVRQTC
jgi:hypothetical protein